MADETPSTLQPIPQTDITDPAPELPVWSNIDHLKQQPRYRNSISTESPIVMLTPPNPDEVVREERRLSNASAHSITSSSANNDNPASNTEDSHHDDNHLVPPAEPEPEEVVAKLISQRRASTITTLSHVIKQIFIEKKVKEDGIPSEIVKGVYLGSIGAAKNLEWLKKNNVTHILCVAGGIGECFPKQFTYKVIDILDAPNEDISAHFKSSYEFIEDALKNNGKVLVHCFAGCSRSVTVVSAYLMQKKRMYAVPALKFVKQRRHQANPNAGFIVQLIKFQNVIGLKQRKNELDLPSASDHESHSEDEEEEKAMKPKKKTFKSLALRLRNKKKMEEVKKALDKEKNDNINNNNKNDDNNTNDKKHNDDDQNDHNKDNNHPQHNHEDDNHKSLTIRLNSPMVKEWENGRRPSLFTALAKLRGMKNRSRQNSMDSVHSNVSAMSTTDNLEAGAVSRKTSGSSPNTLQPMTAISIHPVHLNISDINHNNHGGNNRKPSSPVSPLESGHKLDLLREVTDEIDDDEDDHHKIKQPGISLSGLSRNVGGDKHRISNDEEDAITPLEDLNHNTFPDINSDENKENGLAPIEVIEQSPKAQPIEQSVTTPTTTEL